MTQVKVARTPDTPTEAEQAAAQATPAGLAWLASGRRWQPVHHLRYLASELVSAVHQDRYRAVADAPPRHGKSELLSKYGPAWVLCRWPHLRIMVASYEATFAATWGMKARDVVAEWGPKLYGVRVHPEVSARDHWQVQAWDGRRWVDTGGGMVTAGVGGPLTGKGADLLIVDDPVKNMKEAQSPTYRNATHDWFRSVALTRLEPGGSVFVMHTRWHADDLAGRLLRSDDDELGTYRHLHLPAVARDPADECPACHRHHPDPIGRQPGQALWPARFDLEQLDAIRSGVGSYVWAALYQGNPTPAGGSIFTRSNLRYWRRQAPGSPVLTLERGDDREPVRVNQQQLRVFAVADLAITAKATSDYTVVGVFGITPAGALVWLDLWRERMEAADHDQLIRQVKVRWPRAYKLGLEATQYQASLVQRLARAGMPVAALHPDGDKVSRALLAQTYVDAGQLYLPADASWLAALEDELVTFPNGQHDDQVDVLSYAAWELDQQGSSELRAW